MPFTPSSITPRNPAPRVNPRARVPVVTPRPRTPVQQNSASSYMSRIPTVSPTAPIQTPATSQTTKQGTYGTIKHINGGIVYSDPRDNPLFAGNQLPTTSVKPVTTISANDVGTTTSTPIAPITQPDTSGLNVTNTANAGQAEAAANYTPPTTDTSTSPAKSDIQTQIGDYIKRITGQADEENQIRADSGLDEKKQRATELSNSIDQFDKDFRDKIKAIREAPGATTAGVEAAIAKEQVRYEDTRANMYLSYKVANDDYQGAQDIVNSKIDSLEKQNDNLLKAYQLQASYVYNDLTDSEKLKVQNNYAMMQDTHKATLDAYSEAIKNASSAGAPASVLTAIDAAAKDPNATPASVYKAAGAYGQSPSAVSTQVIDVNGTKTLINSKTGAVIKTFTGSEAPASPLQLAQTEGNISQVSDLLTNGYLNTAVGPNTLARTSFSNPFTGGKSNFIAGVEQLRSGLNLTALIQAKAQGATFGALSESELQVLASSATKIGTWAVKNAAGEVTGYRASEKDFKDELTKINNFAKLDYILKGGNPATVNAQLMPDGTLWTVNSNGTYTKLR